jgi:5-enolpyruvylshikimate-3-phosphate synthase
MTRQKAIRGLGQLDDLDVASMIITACVEFEHEQDQSLPDMVKNAAMLAHVAKMVRDIREAERIKIKEAS